MRPRGAKTGSRAAQKRQDEKKTFFVGFRLRPRRPKDAPRATKSAQERPRGAQERPKTLPGEAQDPPQRAPRVDPRIKQFFYHLFRVFS